MDIITKNDGKGKTQSWEAGLEILPTNTMNGYFSASFTGYGATEQEAKDNLIQQMTDLRQMMNDYTA